MADPAGYPGTPGWAKVFGIVVLVLVLLFVILHVAGRGLGDHAPSRDQAPSGAADGHTPPEGGR